MPAQVHDVDSPPHQPPPRVPNINPRPTQRLKQEQEPSPDSPAKSPTADRESRPPAKRSRKAINCDPCRTSKLKCDRAKPCSSCVLRGTAQQCYPGASDESQDDHRGNRIDPHHEIARMRHSLATLESYIIRGGANGAPVPAPPSATSRGTSIPPPATDRPKPELDSINGTSHKSVPGMLAQKGLGGLYAGPTSMVTHLLSFKSTDGQRNAEDADHRGDDSGRSGDEGPSGEPQSRNYDDDLLALLPQLHIIEGLVDYYFEYCNWVYRHVHPPTFSTSWVKFKSGQSADRLVLATLCVIMALAIRYLPDRHALLSSLPHTHEELGTRYYDVARDALSRYRAESRTLSLELVELLLIRTHYLTLSKNDSEEIWAIRGELISIGTAMGLHRDPDKWRMSRELAERRRWAWWHIILLERWQCFLFGRPLSIATHHFDTRMPSYVDPKIDPTGQLFVPNQTLFRLAYILGGIVDDAVSIRPVSYESLVERDRELVAWMDALPKELDLDEYRIARALASPIPGTMRLGVQSIIIRTSYYHIRFSLHRPYAAAVHELTKGPTSSNGKAINGPGEPLSTLEERMAHSLDVAVNAADKLIQLVGQARPDLLSNSSLAVPGHVHWGPFHCFSAAMFFSFQLIANPDQPGANLFRANIRRVIEILGMSRGIAIADKATNMLTALAPLYEPLPPGETPAEREKKKKQVLTVVKGLAFPYHDSPAYTRSHIDSPLHKTTAATSPMGRGLSVAPILPVSAAVASPPSQLHIPHAVSDFIPSPVNVRPSPVHTHASPPNIQPMTHAQPSVHPGMNVIQTHHTPTQSVHASQVIQHPSQPYLSHMPPQHSQYPTQPPEYSDAPVSMQPITVTVPAGFRTVDEQSMWGESIGFGQAEWRAFENYAEGP